MNLLIDEDQVRGNSLTGILRHKATVSSIALMTALAATQPAWATIDNTVTASGTAPGGVAGAVQDTQDETVDVEDADPSFTFTKTADDTTDRLEGDTVTYTYTLTNDGNVSLQNISVADVHEGTNTLSPITLDSNTSTSSTTTDDDVATPNVFDTLGPGDSVSFTSTYVISAADVDNQADNDLDNTATVTVSPVTGTFDPGQDFDDTEEVDLEDRPSLDVSKTADDDTNVTVGQTITYTYVVTNDGNVSISAVSLSDNVTAGTGGNPTPTFQSLNNASGNSSDDNVATPDVVDVLAPGDSATFTGTYVVTQEDVDTLQ